MNLEQATQMSQLNTPSPVKTAKQILSSTQVAYRILARCEAGGYPYKHFPVNRHGAKAWAKKFLTSKEFQLMRINLNAAASPHNPRDPKRIKIYIKDLAAKGVPDFDPIVVDVNRRKEGRTHLGYIPDVIVVDGKHRKASMLASGVSHYFAWVGCKATKKMKPKDINASAENIVLPKVDGTKIASQYEIMCATVPALSMPPRQDSGAGGSRPKDHLHSGGPGSGRKQGLSTGRKFSQQELAKERQRAKSAIRDNGTETHEFKDGSWNKYNYKTGELIDRGVDAGAIGNCEACGAVSTGSLNEKSASDKDGQDISDAAGDSPSDRRTWNPNKPQTAPSINPDNAKQFGLSKQAAYQNNTGPRVINKGGSKSEMSRNLEAFYSHSTMPDKGNFSVDAKKKIKSAVKIDKMYQKKKMQAVAPPGFSEETMHDLKRKHGTTSAFKIAWSTHNKSKKGGK